MCLIIACPPGKRPSLDTLTFSHGRNPDGSGLAWSDKGTVHWSKGLDLLPLLAMLQEIPSESPLVIHHRTATVGGNDLALSHPFLLGQGYTPSEGVTRRGLLFHNGHWANWKDTLLQALLVRREKIAEGAWSDSRALAYLVSVYGERYLDFIDSHQKGCILTPDGFALYGFGWSTHEDCFVSNTYSFRAATFGFESKAKEKQAEKAESKVITPDNPISLEIIDKPTSETERLANWWHERTLIEAQERAKDNRESRFLQAYEDQLEKEGTRLIEEDGDRLWHHGI